MKSEKIKRKRPTTKLLILKKLYATLLPFCHTSEGCFLLIRNKEQKRVRYPQMVSNTDRIQIVKRVHLRSLLNFE